MVVRGRPKTRKTTPGSPEQAAVEPRKPRDRGGDRPHLNDFEKIITREDTKKLLNYLLRRAEKSKSRLATLHYMIVLSILRSGLRAAEVGRLRVDDCFLDRKPAVIRIAGKQREFWEKDEVYIPSEFAKTLIMWIKKDRPRRFVFENKKHSGIDRFSIWRMVKGIFKRLHMSPNYNVHSLRHRFGTDTYIASGKDIEFTRRQLRHKNHVTTSKYIHFATMETDAMDYLSKLGDDKEPEEKKA